MREANVFQHTGTRQRRKAMRVEVSIERGMVKTWRVCGSADHDKLERIDHTIPAPARRPVYAQTQRAISACGQVCQPLHDQKEEKE